MMLWYMFTRVNEKICRGLERTFSSFAPLPSSNKLVPWSVPPSFDVSLTKPFFPVDSVQMRSSVASLLLSSITAALAASPFPPFSGNPFEKYNLSAEGITASWIPYGARLTNLYVKDKNGKPQDVVIGYDTGAEYLHDTETNHTYFGAVVGRYANR